MALAAVVLGACGKAAVPRLPAGVVDQYPRGYPAGAKPVVDPIFSQPGPDLV